MKEKRSSSSSSPLKKRLCKPAETQNPVLVPVQGSGPLRGPSVRQVMLVMSPTGPVQPTQHLQNCAQKNLLAPPLLGSTHPANQPMAFRPLPSGVTPPSRSSISPVQVLLPHKVRSDPTTPPLINSEALQFDPALIFLEPRESLRDWLTGWRGTLIPGLRVGLPYLPPVSSSLSMLSTLLCLQRTLTRLALKVLAGPRPPTTANQQAEVSDCTSDPTPGR